MHNLLFFIGVFLASFIVSLPLGFMAENGNINKKDYNWVIECWKGAIGLSIIITFLTVGITLTVQYFPTF